jgi:hypothetical protein
MSITFDPQNGITYPDSTNQSSAGYPFGSGQTWQVVTSSRAIGVVYTNSTGKIIVVSIGRYGGNYSSTQIYVNGNVAATSGVDQYGGTESMTVFVPVGNTYQVTNNYGTFSGWFELR